MSVNYLDTHKEIFGDGSGDSLVLTTEFVSTTEFRISDHDSLIVELVPVNYSGAIIEIKMELSLDGGTTYYVFNPVSDGVQVSGITGPTLLLYKVVPYTLHRFSVKKVQGDVDCAAILYGSARMGIVGNNIFD